MITYAPPSELAGWEDCRNVPIEIIRIKVFHSIFRNHNLNSEEQFKLIKLLVFEKKYDTCAHSSDLIHEPELFSYSIKDIELTYRVYDRWIRTWRKKEYVHERSGAPYYLYKLEYKPFDAEKTIWDLMITSREYAGKTLQSFINLKFFTPALEFIQLWLNTCRTPDDVIIADLTIANLIKDTQFAAFFSEIKKLSKQRILCIELAVAKELRGEAKSLPKYLGKPAELLFLQQRRPGTFGFFTQRFNTASIELYDKIRDGELKEAKTAIDKKQYKINSKIQKKLDQREPRIRMR